MALTQHHFEVVATFDGNGKLVDINLNDAESATWWDGTVFVSEEEDDVRTVFDDDGLPIELDRDEVAIFEPDGELGAIVKADEWIKADHCDAVWGRDQQALFAIGKLLDAFDNKEES